MGFCKDKELTINGKEVRSPEQQVWKNMQDIEELKKLIKKVYKTSESLTDESITVARNTTNVPEDITYGWLVDANANLFDITGNNGTTLLIVYYTNVSAQI